MNRLEEFLDQLRTAFPVSGVPARPITRHRCGECDEVDRCLGDRTWLDVATDFPKYCHDVYPLLTPDAQRYYLPAYLYMSFGQNVGMQSISIESALRDGRLIPTECTQAQRSAIVKWAKLLWEEDGYESEMPDWLPEAWLDPSIGIDGTHPA